MYDVLEYLLSSSASETLGGLIIGSAARAFVVLLLACLVSIAMRRASAARRHLAWSLAIVVVLALPLGSSLLPRVQIEIPRLAAQPTGRDPASAGNDVAFAARLAESRSTLGGVARDRRSLEGGASPAPGAAAAVIGSEPTGGNSGPSLAAPGAPDAETVVATQPVRSADWPRAVLWIWLIGVTLSLGRLLISGARVRWLERRAGTIDSGPLYRANLHLARQVGLSRPPTLLCGDDTTVPMTWGIRRPRIILPAGAEAWAPWRTEAVLLHELGHIERRDHLAQVAGAVMCALHWFNPLAWLAARRMHVEREHACDDLVVSWGHEPSSYARDLLELARALRPTPLAAATAVCFSRPNRLRDRLVALMDETRDRRPIARGTVGRAGGIALVLALPVAAFAPVPEAIAETKRVTGGPPTESPLAVQGPTMGPPAVEAPGDRLQLAPVEVQLTPAEERPLTAVEIDGPPQSASRASQQATSLCGPRDGDSRRHSSQTSDDVITIEVEYGDCRSSVRIEGDIEFNQDFTSVESLSSRSFLRVEVSRGGERRRVEVRPSSGGRPEFEWFVEGREQPFDQAAQQWFAGALLDLFRTSSYKASERATWILGQDGVEGVLTEVRQMWAGHAQARYLTVLLEEGDLDPSQIRRVLALASREIDSDHSLGTVLGAAAERYSFDATTRGAFIEAAATLESDHQHARVLGIALGRGDLSQENLEALLESATVGLESDHQMAGILMGLAERYPLDSGLRGPFLRAAATLDSDHQKGRVYGVILRQDGLAETELAAVLEAASTVGSDHTLGNLLQEVAARRPSGRATRHALLAAAAAIDSDHNLSQTLGVFSRLDLDPVDLVEVLDTAAGGVGSDHLMAEFLLAIAERHTIDGQVRDAFMRALDTIDSRRQRERVTSAIDRR